MKQSIGFLLRQMQREWLINLRQPKNIIYAALFFAMVTVFFPLAISPDPQLLRQVAPGLLWMAMLLSLLLASERIFYQDYAAGVIEQWLLAEAPLSLRIFAKVCVQWVMILLPMLVLCPWLGLVFSLSPFETGVLALGFICATPGMLFLCAFACAFSMGLSQRGLFMALVILPLTLPIMISGSLGLQAAMQGMPPWPYLALTLAISLLALMFLPLAISLVMRFSLVE